MFAPGRLRAQLRAVSERALASGALQPIATQFQMVEDEGIRFLVRIVAHLEKKRQTDSSSRSAGFNPFLPVDPELYVDDVSPTHVGVLNKFNVVDEHLLIVTREFEHQQSRLNSDDFDALARCLAEYPSLGFYNSGKIAGASQPHKHLQLIPLPLCPGIADVALPPLAGCPPGTVVVGPTTRMPFAHAALSLEGLDWQAPHPAAKALASGYRRLLDRLGIPLPDDRDTRIVSAYNLLVTRAWMLVVPRRQECFAGISLNAMAFAGALLVRGETQLASLCQAGPMAALKHVAGAGSV